MRMPWSCIAIALFVLSSIGDAQRKKSALGPNLRPGASYSNLAQASGGTGSGLTGFNTRTRTIVYFGGGSWDLFGDPDNVVFNVQLPPGTQVVGVGWDTTLATQVNDTFLSEALIAIGTAAEPQAFVAQPSNTGFQGIEINDSDPLFFEDLSAPNILLPDGVLRIELYEGFDDLPDVADSDWITGILTIWHTGPAIGDCVRTSGNLGIGGPATSVTYDGTAWVTDFLGAVSQFDVSDPSTPTPLNTIPTMDQPLDVARRGSLTYVADGSAGLSVFVGLNGVFDQPIPHQANGLDVAGANVYVANGLLGLRTYEVFDIFQPDPVLFTTLDTPGTAWEVASWGGFAFVADLEAGLAVVDVRDPFLPQIIAQLPTPGLAMDVAVELDRVYIADGFEGVHVIDVSDLMSPTLIGTYDTPGEAQGVAVIGSVLVVADGPAGVHILDVSDATQPQLFDSVQFPGFSATDVVLENGVIYVASLEGAIQTIETYCDCEPVVDGTFIDPLADPIEISVENSVSYIVDSLGDLVAIDVADPTNPIEIGDLDGDYVALTVRDRLGFGWNAKTMFAGTFTVIDLSNPRSIVVDGQSSSSDCPAVDIALSGDMAFSAGGDCGLTLYDISVSTNPTMQGTYPDSAFSVEGTELSKLIAGPSMIALVATGTSFLVLDVSDPSVPTFFAELPLTGAVDVALDNKTAYVAAGTNGFHIVDISNPASPSIVGSAMPKIPNAEFRRVEVSSRNAYIIEEAGQQDAALCVIDITNPVAPQIIGTLPLEDDPGFQLDLDVDNGVFVTDFEGLQTIETETCEPTFFTFNGSGLNRDVLSATEMPLGDTWSATLSPRGDRDPGPWALYIGDERSQITVDLGLLLGLHPSGSSEALVGGTPLAKIFAGHHQGGGQSVTHQVQIPLSPLLLGRQWYAQALVFGDLADQPGQLDPGFSSGVGGVLVNP